MRSYFRWPTEVKESVRRHIVERTQRIDIERYRQEPDYVSAWIVSMEGVAYEGEFGFVKFRGTVATSLGRKSAESKYGADFAITATLKQDTRHVEKAVIFQAKKGRVKELDQRELHRLKVQIRKMQAKTSAPKVLQIPRSNEESLTVCSGNYVEADSRYAEIEIGRYIIGYVLTCIEGDIRPVFVAGVQESKFSGLELIAGGSQRIDSSRAG